MNSLILKPIFYYSVLSDNVGDRAIRQAVVDSLQSTIDVPITFLDTKKDELTQERIIKQLNNEASALIVAGGGLYSNCNTSSGWYFNCRPELIKKITVPIILLGIGCNNHIKDDIFKGELTRKAKESILEINNQAILSSVRDKRTYDILKEIGVTNHSLILDPACFLPVKIGIKKEKKVAINLCQHAPSLGRYDGSEETRNKNLEYFTYICNYLSYKGFTPVFIAFDPLEQSLIIDLKKRFPALEYLNTQDINRILETYAKCAFSIGMKMHSNILSFAAGTPFISLYYDTKSIEFLKLIKCEKFGVSVFDNYQNVLTNLIDILSSNYVAITSQFKKLKTNCSRKYNNEIKKIQKIIVNKAYNRPDNAYLENPKVTVLMPTYNRPDFTKEAIDSIINQTYTNWELLIYDDGSTDKTVDLIKSYVKKDSRIKLIEGQINKGGLYAKQMLLDNCKTEVACWQDSDDLSHPDRLKIQVEQLFFYGAIFCNWSYWEEQHNKWVRVLMPNNNKKFHALSSLMFEIDKNITLDKTKIWGSLVWFDAMKNRYPNWTTTSEELYYIRRHPGRITVMKRNIEKLIKKGVITEAEIINLNFEQLREVLEKHKQYLDKNVI